MTEQLRILGACVGVMILAPIGAAWAQDGSSGCGPGWYLFKSNSLMSSSLRATTNNSFGLNTFGMTSGTSGCQAHSIVRKEVEPEYFASANLEVLTVEMSRGEGEYVVALGRVLGCKDVAIPAFARMVQARYSEILPSTHTTAEQALDAVRAGIVSDPYLVAGCSASVASR